MWTIITDTKCIWTVRIERMVDRYGQQSTVVQPTETILAQMYDAGIETLPALNHDGALVGSGADLENLQYYIRKAVGESNV